MDLNFNRTTANRLDWVSDVVCGVVCWDANSGGGHRERLVQGWREEEEERRRSGERGGGVGAVRGEANHTRKTKQQESRG